MYTLKEALQNAGYEIGKKEINIHAINKIGTFSLSDVIDINEDSNTDYTIVRLDEKKTNLVLTNDEQEHVLVMQQGKMYNFLRPGEIVLFDCSLSSKYDIGLVVKFINNCYNILDSVDVHLLVDIFDADSVSEALINIDVIYHEV